MAKDILYPIRRLHGWIYEKQLWLKQRRQIRSQFRAHFKKNPKTVFLLMTPEHGNIGDHAITKAETVLLKKHGINDIEITSREITEMKSKSYTDLFNGFPIFINGGGNLGTLWMDVETLQREIIQKNPKSNIMVLPNTIFYEESEWGQDELEKSLRLYNRHKHLTIYAREQTSYDFMKPIYRDVRLVPDMVLSLKNDDSNIERKGCLICLRSDCEKTITAEQNHTDRLHGMIFCAITGTPCVVINSKSPKVRGCYEWIKHLDYIRFAESPEAIVAEYRLIPKGPHHYDNSHLKDFYQTLAEDIQNIWR